MINHAAHARMFAVFAAGLDHGLVGGFDFRVAILTGYAHLGAQIVGADHHHIHTRQRGNRIGEFNRRRRFQHDDDQGFIVGQCGCFSERQ